MFALNINWATCVKNLWQVLFDRGVKPSLTIILAPGVQAQHKLLFWESFNETLHRMQKQVNTGKLTHLA